MKLETARIQNFKCIADSGELALDEHLTILVGSNECGKTAILEALRSFNRGVQFDDADVSTLTEHNRLFTDNFDRSSVPMVTIRVRLEPAELAQLGLNDATEARVEITKRLDNTYDVKPLFEMPEVFSLPGSGERTKFKAILEGIHKQLDGIYEGRIKSMHYSFSYVFLRRDDTEDDSENLILFAEYAPNIWGQLKTGDAIQVTRTEPDLYGRNTKALNAGTKVDIDRIKNAISFVVQGLNPESPDVHAASIKELIDSVQSIPKSHPVSDYFTKEFLDYMRGIQSQPAVTHLPELTTQIQNSLPDFVYVTDTTTVVDEIPIREYGAEGGGARRLDNLVEALGSLAGLPAIISDQRVSAANRLNMLEQASMAITERYGPLWPKIDIRFRESGDKLTLGITAEGHAHPPTKRSAGLRSFLALLANVFAVGARGNAVLLLDDPGVHLHPKKQQDIGRFLAGQSFPVVMATHLPYLIDPDFLHGVRVVSGRNKSGPHIVTNFEEAGDASKAIFGSLSMRFSNSRVLVVEGKDDWVAYRRGSDICGGGGKACLPPDLPIIQGGGAGNVVWTVSALKSAGARAIVLLDGDDEGKAQQAAIRKISGVMPETVVTLHDVFQQDYELEDLFEPAELSRAKDPRVKTVATFSASTIEKLSRIFSSIAEAYKRV